MQEAVIVSGVRTAVGRSGRGMLKDMRPEEMAGAAVREALARAPGLAPEEIDDVVMGCAFPEGEQGMNVARQIGLRAGLPVSVPGQTLNRFCSSGLQAIANGAQQIMSGMAQVVVAGGVESMSLVPMGGFKLSPDPYLMEHFPDVYLSMGLTAENVAKKYNVSREDQDKFALASHQKAGKAIKEGAFREEIVPLRFTRREIGPDGKVASREVVFDTDEGVRLDTSLEQLASLKPTFHVKGTVTAGNSSQTSDGAAAVVLMSAGKARELGLKPMAVFRSFAAGGVEPGLMGIGPVVAIPRALKLAGLALADIDLIELNEAFAAQSLAVIRELGIDPEKVNVHGGAIALGHPLGCTGAKLTATLIHEMRRREARYGMVTMCIGGGMGAAGIFERA